MTREVTQAFLLLAALATVTSTSCTDRPVDAEVTDEQKRITCKQTCDQGVKCMEMDEQECTDMCLDHERFWDWGCEDLAIERAACLAKVSCDDYSPLTPGGDGPCEPVNDELAACYRKYLDKK